MAEFAGAEVFGTPAPIPRYTEREAIKTRVRATTGLLLKLFSGELQAEHAKKKLVEQITRVQRIYGIPIELNDDFSIAERTTKVKIEKLSTADARAAVRVLEEELGKYPPDYIRSLKIKGFHIADKVSYKTIENNTHVEKPVDGIVDPSGYVYTAVDKNFERFRETIHHEMLHISDYAAIAPLHKPFHLGKWKILNLNESSLNLAWSLHNKRSLGAYSETTALELMKHYPEKRPKGFAENYGSSHPREDRATISHWLFTNPHQLFIKSINDPDLDTKITSLARMWEQRTNGRINLQYFKDLANGKIKPSPEYWSRKPIILQRPAVAS